MIIPSLGMPTFRLPFFFHNPATTEIYTLSLHDALPISEVRAQRRYNELINKGENVQFKDVLKNIEERDHIDTTREDSPLINAADAIVLDNSETNADDQFHFVLQLAKDRIAGRV